MTAIGYDSASGQVVISDNGVYAALTLTAEMQPDGHIQVTSIAGRGEFFIMWSSLTDLGGSSFPTPSAAFAYVQGELAKAPPRRVSFRVAPPSPGQTKFELPTPPSDVNTVVITINGSDYYPPDVAASSVQAVWLGDFQLEPADSVRISYT